MCIRDSTYAADVKKEGDTLTVKRMLEDGYMTIKAQTPCLITCIKAVSYTHLDVYKRQI